jgi:hypothetical protein
MHAQLFYGTILAMKATDAVYAVHSPAEGYMRYELRDVTTSERKMDETQRETVPSVVASVKQFLSDAGGVYTPSDAVQYGDALYGAMNSAGQQMAGLGPADTYPFLQIYSVTDAYGFYEFNVNKPWKELEAYRIGVCCWKNPLVFAAWKDAVTTGGNIDQDMLEPSSVALLENSWLSPDSRMVIPPSPTREQANTDFFEFCHIVSLAPEWYKDGLVRLNPLPAGGFIRPVSFDGMTSPLWVQRPPDQHAATGGDALETLNVTTIDLSSCLPVQPYIVTDLMTAALNASPSVNIYSVDLAEVARGGTPENQLLGHQETLIVRQVREARTHADKAFQSQMSAKSLDEVQTSSIGLGGDQVTLPQNVVPRRQIYSSIFELKTQMKAWAKAGLVEHRGQRFPAERFLQEARRSPQAAEQIVKAAAELLAESNDPRVLVMVAQLGDNTSYRPFYEALLDRLETHVPDARGIRSSTLREDLLKRLADRVPATDPDLSSRAHALLKREGRPDIRLEMLIYFDPASEIVDVLAEVSQHTANPWLMANAIAHIAARQPERLIEAAGYISRQSEKTRVLAYSEIRRAVPAVIESQGENLEKSLDLK